MKAFDKFLVGLYLKLDKKKILYPKGKERIKDFGQIKLKSDVLDGGGYHYYDSEKSYQEISSKLYDLINDALLPKFVLDIGANYGFISSVAALKMPQAKIIAVEPSEKLIPYIEANFESNKLKNYEILNSLCGNTVSDSHDFAINPYSSQDNRVVSPDANWVSKKISMVSIDSILGNINANDGVFIKIDTQGFEEKVFEGAEVFLGSHKKWIIKTEFAPHWLKAQRTDPAKFLSKLVAKYDVAELPDNITYFTKNIDTLFENKVTSADIVKFVNHIENTNDKELGWCDLIIRSKDKISA